jgi:hypothetical protein
MIIGGCIWVAMVRVVVISIIWFSAGNTSMEAGWAAFRQAATA